MTVDPGILAENAQSLALLESVAARPELLDRDLGDGWTVAMLLAHLAFWDRLVVQELRRWERDGTPPERISDDLVNESLLDEWRALQPEAAAKLAVKAGRAVNRAVESVSEQVARQMLEEGHDRLLNRGLHRREHLDGIGIF